jgi:hypothetical protein
MVRSRGAVLIYLFFTKEKGGGSLHSAQAVLVAKRAASGPMSAKPRGKSIRRAVFDVRISTPAGFHSAAVACLNCPRLL